MGMLNRLIIKSGSKKSVKNVLIISCLLFVFIPLISVAQTSTYKGFPSLVWPKLYNITFEKVKDALGSFDKPVFTPAVKALNGKSVILPGYMVPFESGMKGNHFMFSSMPLNACFFCGVGGPETVVEIFSSSTVNYSEKPIEIKGILKLNSTNPDKMIYSIENAEIIGEVGF
jgi:hypothetical protein